MSVYFTALLLTLVITALGDYKCRMFSQPANCKNNSRIRISKTDRGTQYRLVLCANNQCCDNTTITFECADICDACKMIVSDRRGTVTSHNHNYNTFSLIIILFMKLVT